MRIRATFILLLLWCTSSAQEFVFDHYSIRDGLPQSYVKCILQDSDGYLWVGTENGLSRFNGADFRNFSTTNGLAENYITALYQDSRGTIWIGHYSGQISYVAGDSFANLQFSGDAPITSEIPAFSEDKSGNIWAVSYESGAIQFHPDKIEGGVLTKFKPYAEKQKLGGLLVDIQSYRGRVHILDGYGIKAWDDSSRAFEYINTPNVLIGSMTAFALTDTINWYGSKFLGVYRHDKRNGELTNFPVADVVSLRLDSSGNLYGGSWGEGAFVLRGKNFARLNDANGLKGTKVTCTLVDQDENVWFGTRSEGLNYYKGKYFLNYDHKLYTPGKAVWSITRNNGNLLFGTNESVISMSASGETSTIHTLYEKGNDVFTQVMGIAVDNDNNIWVGTFGSGLKVLNQQGREVKNYGRFAGLLTDHITSVTKDNTGRIWAGTGTHGVYVFGDEIKNYSTLNGLRVNDINTVFEDSKGNTWIGTKGGGVSVIWKGFEEVSPEFPKHESLDVLSIKEDEGGIWMATGGQGLFHYNIATKELVNYTTSNGLPSNYILFVEPHDNVDHPWVGTPKGLFRYNASEGIARQIEGWPPTEPMPNAVMSDGGRLWIGTNGGLINFDPSQVPTDLVPPQVIMKGWKVLLKNTALVEGTELSYEENHVNFHFETIYLPNAAGALVSYRMKGLEDNWSEPARIDHVTYDFLPPGEFTFEVRPCLNGDCNGGITSFTFTVIPPFWMRWEFYLVLVVVMLALGVGILKYREARLRAQNKHLEEMVAQRTAELQQKNKEILDSINYAKIIQDAVMRPQDDIKKFLNDSFVFYLPKDIVSGDFYWMEKVDDTLLFAAVDCTGHGVPGALVSIVGHNGLTRAVKEFQILEPAKILDKLNQFVAETFHTKDGKGVKDGMDIALVAIDMKTKTMQFAGANNPLYILRKKGNSFATDSTQFTAAVEGDKFDLFEIKPDKQPIGSFDGRKDFTNHSFDIEPGDAIYFFSDGYADQFGGPREKKFKYRPFKQLILNMQDKTQDQQKELLDKTLHDWKGELEQVDDILVMGLHPVRDD